jgi:predicted XRE-type DNA-binding protein
MRSRRRVSDAIAAALEEIQAEADDATAARDASWLTETLRAATLQAGAVRKTVIERWVANSDLTVTQIANRLGITRGRLNQILHPKQKARQED